MKAAGNNRHGHRDATMILLAFRHGLRASELCSLRWDQADLVHGRRNFLASGYAVLIIVLSRCSSKIFEFSLFELDVPDPVHRPFVLPRWATHDLYSWTRITRGLLRPQSLLQGIRSATARLLRRMSTVGPMEVIMADQSEQALVARYAAGTADEARLEALHREGLARCPCRPNGEGRNCITTRRQRERP
jgi:hypothetical protein